MLYWVWLTQINGIGPKRQRALLERFNTPENVTLWDRRKDLGAHFTKNQMLLILST
jgi:excinuclease UvrABC nuclease subunit